MKSDCDYLLYNSFSEVVLDIHYNSSSRMSLFVVLD